MVQVFIPSQLTSYTDGVSRLAAAGGSIEQVLDDLDQRFPGLKFRVIDEQDRIRRHMRSSATATAPRTSASRWTRPTRC